MEPNNQDYNPTINNCLNLYSEFLHVPRKGEWEWTEKLLRHVFGNQYELGLRYLQILYLHPDRSTVILALISRERQTGKTTFLNWIYTLFGGNVALISSSDFLSGFNGSYGTKNIIEIEETLFEKRLTIEKLKALATSKLIQINEKFVIPYTIPFYGKIILTSNNEEKFALVDEDEIRFLVRKLGKPEFTNHFIEEDLIKEIPAFLYYLRSLPPVDWSVSRSGFTAEELKNESLEAVMKESKSDLFKELEIYISVFFNNNPVECFYACPIDIKERYFSTNNQIKLSYIRNVLKNDFKKLPGENQRYSPFGDDMIKRVGTPYLFLRGEFVKDVNPVLL